MRKPGFLIACLIPLTFWLMSCGSPGNDPVDSGSDIPDTQQTDSVDDLGWDVPDNPGKDTHEIIDDLPLDSPDIEDVGPICGDDVCDDTESCEDCPEDCGACEPVCGDGTCEDPEDCESCPDDCGECIEWCPGYEGDDDCCAVDNPCSLEANEICDCGGTCSWDEQECGTPECGNSLCDGEETCQSCPEDCGECQPVCGDGTCEPPEEDCETCEEDCGECTANCGNGSCDEEEDCESCPQDCGLCPPECGDDVCEEPEEDCESCPEDCGACGPDCGDGVLQTENGEECDDNNAFNGDGCDEFCLVEPQLAAPGDVIVTEIMRNPTTPLDSDGEWVEIFNTTYSPIDINAWYLQDEGIDSHRIFVVGGLVMQPQTYMVLAYNGDEMTNGGLEVDYVYSDFFLSNNDDEVVLRSGDVVIDSVAYDSDGDWPDPVGKSMSLNVMYYGSDTNDQGANWCDATASYGDGDFGSPGQMNPVCEVQSMCGDSFCQNDETCESCPQDCGVCPECGDGTCNGDETCVSCPQDCGDCCGNGTCDEGLGENAVSCPQDCVVCGDGECNGGETCESCEADCGECDPCGDGTCDASENCLLCPADCGYCCGNGTCEPDYGETYQNCPEDCQVCGDDVCNGFETCETCPGDCGACPIEGWCTIHGASGTEASCLVQLAASEQTSPKATGLEFLFNYDSTRVAFLRFHDEYCAGDTCLDWNTPPQGSIQPTGHTLAYEPQSAGQTKVLIYHGSLPTMGITTAYFDGSELVGDAGVVEIVFFLSQTIPEDNPVQVTLSSLKATDASANSLYVSQTDVGVLITSAFSAGYCGDGTCDPFETCDTCSGDCGACVCGDGICNLTEDCEGCPDDCGECPPECGDGTCEGTEDCSSCPADCGCQCGESCQLGACVFTACDEKECGSDGCGGSCGTCDEHYECQSNSCLYVPYCGDGTCDPNEDCSSCSVDCGDCPPQCGDDTCDPDETCNSCSVDCGECCGNGTCDSEWGETCANCAGDCGCTCGESCTGGACIFSACDDKECGSDGCGGSCGTCDEHYECQDGSCIYVPYCGDTQCNGYEDCDTCPGDCGDCCGNGACQPGFGENCNTCEADCGSCCPNASCDTAWGEDCSTCPQDCGTCANEDWCSLYGTAGSEVSCLIQLAGYDSGAPDATGAEFVLNFDHSQVSFTRFHDEFCSGDVCMDWDTPPQGTIQPSGHTLAYETIAVGQVKALLYHGSVPSTPLTGAYLSGDNVVGDAELVELVFTLDQTIDPGSAVVVTLSGLKATDASANSINVTDSEGMLLVSATDDDYCGDDNCDASESCHSCAADCGECCGNGTCDEGFGETCENCPTDCGDCPATCGDGTCDPDETCETCADDCGSCISGWCVVSGTSGSEVSCLVELAAESSSSPAPCGIEFVFNFDDAKASFTKFHDELCIGDTCLDWDTPSQGSIQPSGHTLAYEEQSAGAVKAIIYHGSAPSTAITSAYWNGSTLAGEADVMEIVFTLNQTVTAIDPLVVELTGLKATDGDANPMTMELNSGVLTTSAQ